MTKPKQPAEGTIPALEILLPMLIMASPEEVRDLRRWLPTMQDDNLDTLLDRLAQLTKLAQAEKNLR